MRVTEPPVNGINLWLMTVARQVRNQDGSAHEALAIIQSHEGQLRRSLKPGEAERAVNKVFSTDIGAAPPKRKDPAWRKEKTGLAALRYKRTAADLMEDSPVRIDEGLTQTMILRELFPDPAGLICVGKSPFEFHTARLDQFRDLTKVQFIVACYMTKQIGQTQEGKPSMHCLDNCGPRRFCVCDFDDPSSEHHASIIWHLKDLARLVMVVNSGSKSLHGWFMVRPEHEDFFWKKALEFGADAALMRNRSSFVRIPMGTRDNGNRQSVLYFNPAN